jgi:hypothetical protein
VKQSITVNNIADFREFYVHILQFFNIQFLSKVLSEQIYQEAAAI